MSERNITEGRELKGAKAETADTTRTRLIDAATEIFADVGYRRATVREICSRAGVSVALVNYHFGDKRELYDEVLQRLLKSSRLEEFRMALNQKAPPEQILRDAIRARLRGACDSDHAGRFFRILAHELAEPSSAMSRMVQEVSQPLFHQMCEAVGFLMGLPSDAEKTRLCAQSIMGQTLLYVLAGPLFSRLWPNLRLTPENVDRIAGHIFEFSLAYLQQYGRNKSLDMTVNEENRNERGDGGYGGYESGAGSRSSEIPDVTGLHGKE